MSIRNVCSTPIWRAHPAFDSASSATWWTSWLYPKPHQARTTLIDERRVIPLLDSLATHPSNNGNISKTAAGELADWKYVNAKAGNLSRNSRAVLVQHTSERSGGPGHLSLLVMKNVSAQDARSQTR